MTFLRNLFFTMEVLYLNSQDVFTWEKFQSGIFVFK